MVITENVKKEIVERIKKRLIDKGKERNIKLKIEEDGYYMDDDWLYICVTPAKSGIHASEYAEILSDIEKELRDDKYDKVLLIPTISD